MSKLYMTAKSDAIKTARTARGHHWIKATLQSWDGSIQIIMEYHEDGSGPFISLYVEGGSTAEPAFRVWTKRLEELLDGHKA